MAFSVRHKAGGDSRKLTSSSESQGVLTLQALTLISIKFLLAYSTPEVMRIKDMITQGEFS